MFARGKLPNPQRSVDNPGKRPSAVLRGVRRVGWRESVRLAFGRSWTILRLLTETLWADRGCNRGLRGKEDQDALGRRIVQSSQAILIFFNSRRESLRKSWTVRLSPALSGSAPNWR